MNFIRNVRMNFVNVLPFLIALLCTALGSPRVNDEVSRRHTRQASRCTSDIEANPPSSICLGVSLDDISVESLGDDADIIRSLSLIGSSVETLPASAFAHLPALTDLTIARSGLQTLESNSFLGIEGLARLNLSRNEIANLDVPYFTLLKDLKKLNLSKNSIATISNGGLEGLRSLQVLDLSANALTTLPAGIFQQTPGLRSLDLSGNQLARLPTGLFGRLDSLLALDLSKNKLVQLPNKLFGAVPNLSRLVVSYNNLRTISSDAFTQNQPKLTLLRIEFNEISWVDTPALAARFPGLQRVSIVPNPWRCACYNTISQWLLNKGTVTFVKDFSEGKLPICIVVQPVASGRQLMPSNECKKPTEQEGAQLRTAYRNQLNRTSTSTSQKILTTRILT